MNVFFLTQWYPTPESPINGIFIREHARAISLFHNVFVVYVKGVQESDYSTPKILIDEDEHLTTFTISYPQSWLPKTAWWQRINLVFKVFNKLVNSGNQPDIIHANVYNTADLAALLRKRYRIPAVLTEHSSSFPRRLISNKRAVLIRYFVNQLQLILPVSEDLIQHMEAYRIQGPFHVIPNTVNTNIFYPEAAKPSKPDGMIRILAVASLVEVKRIDLLLHALTILKGKGRRFSLMIAGDGPERGKLEALARTLNLSTDTTFLGMKTKDEISGLMKQADILSLTSMWENQPVVVLEALASGLPVLAPSIGGIPEIVLPGCGRLFDPGNIQSIVTEMEQLLDNLQDYRSDNIAEYAHNKFSYTAVGQTYSLAYQQVMEEHKR